MVVSGDLHAKRCALHVGSSGHEDKECGQTWLKLCVCALNSWSCNQFGKSGGEEKKRERGASVESHKKICVSFS